MVQAFEERVTDSRDVTREGRRLFMGEGTLDDAAEKLSAELKRRGIPHAFMGGWAIIRHGYKRYTEDLDLLVTLENRKRIHEELVGLGYKALFAGSKNIRDVATGVRIDVVAAGGFPGDGKPKPVAFPDPATLKLQEKNGVPFIPLDKLIELKLASGMTGGPARLKDFADAIELIRLQHLDDGFAQRLDPYVREKYVELLQGVRAAEARGDYSEGNGF